MPDFKPLPQSRLHQLSSEDLVEYMRDAREAGDLAEMRRAAGFFLGREQRRITNKVKLKVPTEQVEDLVGTIMLNFLETAITASSIGEVRSLLNTIISRRIADLTAENQRKPPGEKLSDEHEGDEENYVKASGFNPDSTSEVIAEELLEQAMEGLNDEHRRVVDLCGREHPRLEGRSAAETAAMVAEEFGSKMTEANVHKIMSRFRARLKQIIREAENSGAGEERSDG